MRMSGVHRYTICAVGAVVLTSLSSAVFVAAEPRQPADRKKSATHEARNPDPEQIARGRYLVKITGCNDCHTPGYIQTAGKVVESQWLTGDRLGWQGPWGTTYPPNLRLFVQNLTVQQWLLIARQPMRPPMPWFALREMRDEDLAAIYHYVRSLGPAGAAAPQYLPPGEPAQTPVVKVPSDASSTPGSR